MQSLTQPTLNLERFDLNAEVARLSPASQARIMRLLAEVKEIEIRDKHRKDHILANLHWPKTKSALLDRLNDGKLGHYSADTLERLLSELEISGAIVRRNNHIIRVQHG